LGGAEQLDARHGRDRLGSSRPTDAVGAAVTGQQLALLLVLLLVAALVFLFSKWWLHVVAVT
jgi:hypothetical protein